MAEEYFIIKGEKDLQGEIEAKGCKNAATPIIASTLLTEESCRIKNLPLVEDIFRMLDIIQELGGKVDWVDKKEVEINTKHVDPQKINKDLVKKLRSSVLLLGPLLARFGEISLPDPGGCLIGTRSIDSHLDAFSQLGAQITQDEKWHHISAKQLKPQEIVLKELSVTATENALMAASLIPGKTIIKITAIEPHVKDLSKVISKMGAEIKWREDHTIEVEGKESLKGFSHFLIYDPTEAGSFIILASVVNGDITIKNVPVNELTLPLKKLQEFGITTSIINSRNSPSGQKIEDIKMVRKKRLFPVDKIQTLPYPGIPTDLQCAFGVLATQAPDETLIHDPMYEGRLKYLNTLNRMGADITVLNRHEALINGPSPLYGVNIENYDLRSGSSLIIAALIAEGETTISNIYQIDRGYEKIEERLQSLGADIQRAKE